MRLIAAICLAWLLAGCSEPNLGHAGQSTPGEFDQPLPEPALRQATNAPSGSAALAQLHASGLTSAVFKLVGTDQTPRAQGQIGARIYRLNGQLTSRPVALEVQPWDDPMTGLQPDIDGRGDFISINGTVYVRTNTLNAWQVVSADDPYWSLFVNINPAGWVGASSAQTLGQATIDGSATWVVQARNGLGHPFKVWLRQRDYVPLRYTAAWANAKGQIYYINALYANSNSEVEITPPDTSNRGVVQLGTPVAVQSGSVTVRDLAFDCVGTAFRHPAHHDKFVLELLAFVDGGQGSVSIDPADWRLYGDGVNGVSPSTIGVSDELHAQTLTHGQQVTGRLAFEVPDVAYQLLTVGKVPGATVVVSTFLPMLPNGESPCP
ncbi:MAG TPA: hypothetical protein VGG31_02365 [Candidatus Dormibacteraeota bacterium]